MKYLIKKPDTFLDALNDDINSILHRNFDSLFPESLFNQESQGMAMPVEIKEFDDSFELKLELPGVKKEDISVDINKASVKIDAHKESEKEENNKTKKYHKSEFKYGQYSRTLYFPQDINVKGSSAELKNGLLKVHLPKLESEELKSSKLEIKEK